MPRFAAVDIGSNSCRLEVAEIHPGEPLRILTSEREVTRLGVGVFRAGRISQESLDFLSGVLTGMAAQYRRLEVDAVRAVATSAVRDASNQHEFLARASAALGTNVEVISGTEEARLIHLGVQMRWPHPRKRVLMIDIGGGSAEIILSGDQRLEFAVSKQLGALRLNEVFLRADPPRERDLHRMEEYIEERMGSAVRRVLRAIGTHQIDRVVGTSATASAIVCAVNRIPRQRRDEADKMRAPTTQIRKLYNDLVKSTLAERQKIVGIGPRRAEIIIPGCAVLLRLLEDLKLPALYYSVAGVRDGIIADLADRGYFYESLELSAERRATVEELAQHYAVPLKHARKTGRTAIELFQALSPLHKLPPPFAGLVEAAGYLHDIGHFISDTRHHKHSFYLVANSDMPGFDEREREIVANLCRYHRKAAPVQEHPNWQTLDPEGKRAVLMLAPILRLADSIDRSRDQRVESVSCTLRDTDVLLELTAAKDIDLEIWATERTGEFFRSVYGRPLVVKAVAS
jgi:exopolyphosphatase/guanosine-5'-triphosphate,3'-diphosphate pyrophosphatase